MEKQQLPNLAASNPNPIHIQQSSLLTSLSAEIMQGLICPICQGLVYRPIECHQCQTLFCQDEITRLSSVCPLCKSSKWKSSDLIHRSYKQRLMGLQMKCPSEECPVNKEAISYDRYVRHVMECGLVVWGEKPKFQVAVPGEGEEGEGFFQFTYGEGLTYKPYSELDNISINLNLRANIKIFELGQNIINLQKKQQLSKTQKHKRPIKINPLVNHKPHFWWLTQLQSNQFTLYDLKTQNAIQSNYKIYQKSKKPSIFKFRYLNKQLTIDFDKMLQVNQLNKRSVKVLRVSI